MRIYILIVIILTITLLCSIRKNTYSNFTNHTNHINSEIVIARYNENLEWLNKLPDVQVIDQITIYNKGPPLQTNTINYKNIQVINLPNVGRCDHTYLYHIVNRYDTLADITIFLPGSAEFQDKWDITKTTLSKAVQTKNSVFHGAIVDNVKKNEYNFQLDKWIASYDKNKEINNESNLYPASPRPYGKWFENNYGDLNINFVTYRGIFAVSKEHVLQHDVSWYQNLLKQLEVSSNPEVGHYIERSWVATFHPIPKECYYIGYTT